MRVDVASGRGVGVEAGVWVELGVVGSDVTVTTAVGSGLTVTTAVGSGLTVATEAVGLERGAVVGDCDTGAARWGAGVGVGVGAARAGADAAKLSSSHPTASEDDSRMNPD